MRSLLVLSLGGLLLAAGCRTAPAVKESFDYRAGLKPAAYFPLGAGAVWSYRANIVGVSNDMLVINKVAAFDGKRAMFGTDYGYEDRGDTIVRLPSETEVLRTPIEKGARWAIPGGEAVIAAVDAVVDAPAGHYASCVLVEETTVDRRRVTYFAPAVGPVREEIFARDPGKAAGDAGSLVSSALLQSYASGAQLP